MKKNPGGANGPSSHSDAREGNTRVTHESLAKKDEGVKNAEEGNDEGESEEQMRERLERERFEKELIEDHKRKKSVEKSPPEESETDSNIAGDVRQRTKRKANSPKENLEAKRKNVGKESEESETEPDVEVEDEFERIRFMMEQLVKNMEDMVLKKKISKSNCERQMVLAREVEKSLRNIEIEQAEMRGRLKERKKVVEEVVRVVGMRDKVVKEGGDGVQSYAEAASGKGEKEQRADGTIPKGKVRTEIILTMEGCDPEEVKARFMRNKPKDIGVNIDKIIKTRRGVILEVNSREEAEKLKGNQKLIEEGYEMKEGTKKNPMVLIYDVDAGSKEDEVMKEMWERNVMEIGMKEDEFLRAVKVRRKMIQKGKDGNREERNKGENWIM
ncbi:DNA ligase 1-like [Macrosteles quadrilineatus]|uniref:DNA ligase 1-like n=1 Tax=Macrosteles quadrilineatus TaxID=74068 RepID=UPI0023E331DD|nr:DNA ligase 1-like [Macrosteles quadrilineatus]